MRCRHKENVDIFTRTDKSAKLNQSGAIKPHFTEGKRGVRFTGLDSLYLHYKPQIYPTASKIIGYAVYRIAKIFDEHIGYSIVHLQEIEHLQAHP